MASTSSHDPRNADLLVGSPVANEHLDVPDILQRNKGI
jgi:hypothetical protein